MHHRLIPALLVLVSIISVPVFSEPAEKPLTNPHIILRALLVAYPDKVKDLNYDFTEDQWYITVGSTRLFWADGRLLPHDELQDTAKWLPYIDYLYPEAVPDPKKFSPGLIEQLNTRALEVRRSNEKPYNIAFYDCLYDGATRRSIEANIIREDYLGKRVSMHRDMFPKLRNIERKIMKLAETDEEVRAFVENIKSIQGYNWRDITDRPLRSNHSWGIALDILPLGWNRKNVYWYWISQFNDEWMFVPPSRRWAPPDAVIKIFESEGFIWGGKWYLWDTIHFEYRPELLVLQRWGYSQEACR